MTVAKYSLDEESADMAGLLIPGKFGRLFSTYYSAAGRGTHPTIILCHGFPGNEQQLDLAQALRYYGYNVLTFHYSGCWGSDGVYCFRHCIKDTESVLDYLLEHSKELKADTEHLGIIGHSLGGFVASHVYAARDELKACSLITPSDPGEFISHTSQDPQIRTVLQDYLNQSSEWLKGTTGDLLFHEIAENAAEYRISSLAPELCRKSLQVIEADHDIIITSDYNIYPFINSIQALASSNAYGYATEDQQENSRELLEHVVMHTDHYQSGQRIELFHIIREYLDRVL